MAVPSRNKTRRKESGSRVAALVILVFIIGTVACYYFLSSTGKSGVTLRKPESSPVRPSPPRTPAIPQPVTPEPPHLSKAEPPQLSKTEPPQLPKKDAVPAEAQPVSEPEQVRSPAVAPVRLAIIIDDMGGSMAEARSLAGIKVPLTFSIIPGLRADREVAAFAASGKIETMIHIPMQSKGWPERRLEANGLLVSMTDGELQEKVSGFVRQFPGAVGANNHMGSEFTEHGEKMSPVLQVLKEKNLFFVDSVTSPASKGLTVARHLGMRSARRQVFLDNEQERGYILGQLKQAVKQARKSGAAIAICHPHPETIAALAAALPGLSRQGVSLVPASQLVR